MSSEKPLILYTGRTPNGEYIYSSFLYSVTDRYSIGYKVSVYLEELKETYGEDMVTLDLVSNPRKITVTGDEEIRHRLDRLFAESFNDWTSTSGTGDVEHTCPICMCPATAPSAPTFLDDDDLGHDEHNGAAGAAFSPLPRYER